LLGSILAVVKWRKSSDQKEVFFSALLTASLALLALVTLLPQLSVDYSITRLFQQILIIGALPMLMAIIFLCKFAGRLKWPLVGIVVGLLFFILSGTTAQLLGGSRPRLSMNNAGEYYNFFSMHESDIQAAEWLDKNRNGKAVFMDTDSAIRPLPYPVRVGLVPSATSNSGRGYLHLDYMNVNTGLYRVFLKSELAVYADPEPTADRNLLYTTNGGQVYDERKAQN
jgi:uncharacterized membrane protein